MIAGRLRAKFVKTSDGTFAFVPSFLIFFKFYVKSKIGLVKVLRGIFREIDLTELLHQMKHKSLWKLPRNFANIPSKLINQLDSGLAGAKI